MSHEPMTFTTPKGTVIPFTMIPRRAKDKKTGMWRDMPPQPYLAVAHRIVWFREEHPDWTIRVELVVREQDFTLARAQIIDPTGRVISEAHKQETSSDWGDHTEKAETGAIGRALAYCGYGTAYAIELVEGDDVVDAPAPVPQKKDPPPSPKPQAPQAPDTSTGELRITFGPFVKRTVEEVIMTEGQAVMEDYVIELRAKAREKKKTIQGIVKDIIDRAEQLLGPIPDPAPKPVEAPRVEMATLDQIRNLIEKCTRYDVSPRELNDFVSERGDSFASMKLKTYTESDRWLDLRGGKG